MVAHGVIGGVSSELSGGKFSSGFISSAFAKVATPGVSNAIGDNVIAKTVAMATVAGTASELAGGKFANGAMSGAFAYLYNELGKNEMRRNSTWDPLTDKRISGLHPAVQGPAAAFINAAETELGMRLRVASGWRSIEEQDALYAQGRTMPGRIVTDAPGGKSYHNYGLAIDVVEIRDNQAVWERDWTSIGKLGIRHGFEWGGHWPKPDRPHFQMTFGLSIEDL